MIIDAHTHTFPEKIADKAVAKLEKMADSKAFIRATDSALTESMKKAGIDISVILPVATSPQQVEKLNDYSIAKNELFNETGLFFLGAMHPEYENYKSELRRIKEKGLTGIKIHPAYQATDLDDIRFLNIIEEASSLDLAVVIHAGWDIGIMERNFASVDMICNVLKKIAPKKFVAAHLGSWTDWDAVESTLAGEALYMDTSFIFDTEKSDKEKPYKMIETAQFERIVKKHGYEKILFGSDSPWSSQSESLKCVTQAALDKEKMHLLLGENARKLFDVPSV